MDKFKLSQKHFVISLIILAVIHLGFLFFAVRHESYLVKDSHEYLQQAENLLAGSGWYAGDLNEPHQPNLESRRPPLYAFFLSLIRIFSQNDLLILIAQNLLSLLTFAALIYLLMQFRFENRFISFLFLPFIFFPSQFIFSNIIMAEVLFQTFIFWAFFFMILFLKKENIMLLVLHSIFIGLAILTKPALYLFWIIELIFFIYLFLRKKITLTSISIAFIPLFCVIILSFYNESKTGYFHYSSMKEINLLAYNTYLTLRLDHSEADAKNILDSIHNSAVNKSENFKELSQNLENSAVNIIKNNLPGYFYLQLKGMLNFFIDIGRHDMFLFFYNDFNESEQGISYYFKSDGISGVLNYLKQYDILFIFYSFSILIVNIILLTSFIFFPFNSKISLEIRIFIFLLIFYLAFITGPIGSARFRVPVYPLLLFTLPFFIDYVKNSHFYKKLKWR